MKEFGYTFKELKEMSIDQLLFLSVGLKKWYKLRRKRRHIK